MAAFGVIIEVSKTVRAYLDDANIVVGSRVAMIGIDSGDLKTLPADGN